MKIKSVGRRSRVYMRSRMQTKPIKLKTIILLLFSFFLSILTRWRPANIQRYHELWQKKIWIVFELGLNRTSGTNTWFSIRRNGKCKWTSTTTTGNNMPLHHPIESASRFSLSLSLLTRDNASKWNLSTPDSIFVWWKCICIG